MTKTTNLDAYKHTGINTDRTIVFNNTYLNNRVERFCSICDTETVQDPKGDSIYHCCSCDFDNKDTDLGQVIFVEQIINNKIYPKWIKWNK